MWPGFRAPSLLTLGVVSVNVACAAFTGASPLESVVKLLEDVKGKVTLEGEEEAKTYDTFACFCKDTTKETLSSITSGEDLKNDLGAELNEAMVGRDAQDADIAAATAALGELDGVLEELRSTRRGERVTYEQNEVDLTGAIQGVEAAIEMLKAAKTATSLAQLGPTVRKALSMAEVLSPAKPGSKVAAVLAQFEAKDAPEYEPFNFHSDDIISTLEGLLTDFENKRTELNEAETSARELFDKLVADKEAAIAEKQAALEEARKGHAERSTEIATISQDLSTTSAKLLVDKEYLQELTSTCNTKAVLWDQRTTTRANELGAIEQALTLIGEAAGASSAASLIQLAQVPSLHLFVRPPGTSRSPGTSNVLSSRARAAALLRTRAAALNSTLLMSVTAQVADDPFAKVKKLIQELIERLLKQAQEEASHKGWCDEQVALARQQRDYAEEAIKDLNGELAVGVARRAKLAELVATLETELGDLNATLANRTAMRKEEKAENEAAIQTAEDAKAAVEEATDILSKFYATAEKASETSLLQRSSKSSLVAVHRHVAGGRNESIPDAGFDSAYTGAQADSGGIIGMLDVIKSDFARTIAETKKAEEDAEKDFLELETSAGSAKAEKEVALKERERALAEADAKDLEDNTNLNTSSVRINQAVNELLALKPACMDGGISAEEKKAQREAELEALQQALCILDQHEHGGVGKSAVSC
jgi:hypothetical protein